jgi:hypothetical protein
MKRRRRSYRKRNASDWPATQDGSGGEQQGRGAWVPRLLEFKDGFQRLLLGPNSRRPQQYSLRVAYIESSARYRPIFFAACRHEFRGILVNCECQRSPETPFDDFPHRSRPPVPARQIVSGSSWDDPLQSNQCRRRMVARLANVAGGRSGLGEPGGPLRFWRPAHFPQPAAGTRTSGSRPAIGLGSSTLRETVFR